MEAASGAGEDDQAAMALLANAVAAQEGAEADEAPVAEAEEAPSPPIQAAPEEDPKQVAANSIEPGCAQYTISSWMPKSEKPTHKHLLAAMGEQGSNRIIPEGERKPQPGQWPVQKIADWLHDHAKPADQGAHSTEKVRSTAARRAQRLGAGCWSTELGSVLVWSGLPDTELPRCRSGPGFGHPVPIPSGSPRR